MSILGKVDVTWCSADGEEVTVAMHKCNERTRDRTKCRVETFSLFAKVSHVDCEPVDLELKAKTLALGGDEYEVIDSGGKCGECSTLYVIKLKRVEVKCTEEIQVYRCVAVGEVGCNQVTSLIPVVTVQGNPCPTVGSQIDNDDNRRHRKSFRIYMSQIDALKVCEVDGMIIAKTSKGNIEIRSESFEGDCPSVSGFLDKKVYEIQQVNG